MLSKRIVKLRQIIGISQAELAKLLCISTSTEGMYEQGRRTPSLDILVKMSEIFGVSLDYLITGKEYPRTNAEKKWEQIVIDCPCQTCYWKNEVIKHCK